MERKSLLFEAKKMDIAICKLIQSKYDNFDCNITPAQGAIIMFIYNSKEDICQHDIENNFKFTKSTISSIISNMEKNGLILKKVSETDSRKNIIVLTDKSLNIVKQILNYNKELDEKLVGNISDSEYETFLTVINKINNNIERM